MLRIRRNNCWKYIELHRKITVKKLGEKIKRRFARSAFGLPRYARDYSRMFLKSFQRPKAVNPSIIAAWIFNDHFVLQTDRFWRSFAFLIAFFFRCRFLHDNDEQLKLLLLIPNLPSSPPSPTSTLGQQLQVLESSASTKAQPLQPEQLQFTLVNQLS